jgi:RNA polymerase sigma factor (sigma-70 family)
MEVSALRYSGGVRLHGGSPLLRLQSDERLIVLMRRGNSSAFEVLVSRYHSRLLAFCRHLLGSKEDAEDVLQEVLAAAFNAILADERPINVRPWLYRIARNRSLNHLRRIQAIGVDSMDIHLAEHGATTADKVHDREQFRLLVRDIQTLPETQRTALVLREMDALSYDQIAEAMDTTVPGVKSLLVRARISLAEAAEARQLSCDEVRIELAEVAEGLHKRPPAIVRRHLRSCNRCGSFQSQLKQTNKVLAALLPVGPLALLRKLLILHLGHSAGTGSGATAGASATGAGASGLAASQAAAVAGTAGGGAAFGSAGGLVSAGALATKAVAGLAAAALVTAGAVEVTHVTPQTRRPPVAPAAPPSSGGASVPVAAASQATAADTARAAVSAKPQAKATKASTPTKPATASAAAPSTAPQHPSGDATATAQPKTTTMTSQPQTQTDPTVLSSGTPSGGSGEATDTSTTPTSSSPTTTSSSTDASCSSGSTTAQPDPSSTPTSTTPSSTTTTPQPPTTTTDSSSAPPTSSSSSTGTTTTTASCPAPAPAPAP